jgi:Bifunctional DNA primase/polymerase, N-terminal
VNAGHPSLTQAALSAAARGWHVFPLRKGDKQPAVPRHKAADCDRSDPWCRDGHQGWEPRATTDPARIAAGWADGAFNVGIAAGPSGLVVIDLDVPKPGEAPPPRWALPGVTDGADVLAVLCEEHGEPMPFETLMVRTRRGGLHLYFQAPPGDGLRNTAGSSPGGLGWLIDTRACGGYVVGPGSVVDLPDGAGRYELVYDREPAPLPAWLASLLTAPRPGTPPVECRSSAPGEVRELDAYARTALYGECERVRAAVEGGRAWALNKAGYCLGRLIAAGALPENVAEAALLDAAAVHFAGDRPVTPAEARASIRGGIAAGKRRPRDLGPAA